MMNKRSFPVIREELEELKPSSWEMDTVVRVQILDEAISVSLRANSEKLSIIFFFPKLWVNSRADWVQIQIV